MSRTLLLCPGQGSQKLGMGKDLADAFEIARRTFEEVDDAINFGLSKVMWGDDESLLSSTQNAQVAIMAVSVAVMRTIEHLSNKSIAEIGQMVGGHSLGEYSALCVAGSISLADCAKLLRKRGESMLMASERQSGGMAALIGVESSVVNALVLECAQGEVLVIANDNSLKQIVISGTKSAIARAKDVSESFGVRRFVELAVSGAFHSPLMQDAQDAMRNEISGLKMIEPAVSLLSGISAKEEMEIETIRDLLLNQITKPVRWTEAMLWAVNNGGVNKMIEIGYGSVLSGLMSQTVQGVESFQSGSVEKIEALLKTLTEQ